MPNLDIAAECFDRWMKKYEASHRKTGTWDDHNEALLQYLGSDDGFCYIKTYEELCQLAVLAQEKGYTAATNPPCAPVEFAQTIQDANPRSFGDIKPTMPKVTSLQIAVERFDKWMKKYEASHRKTGTWDDHNEALLQYLGSDDGFCYIKTYEELCQLAVLAQEKGYTAATNPPCALIEFNEAFEKARFRKAERLRFFASEKRTHPLAQSAETVSFLDAIEGYVRPGGAQNIYTTEVVTPDGMFDLKPFRK